jgi:hypothetical protein
MLTPKQMRILDRAIADLGRADLAELLARLRAIREAEFRDHMREVISGVAESRELRRVRLNEIRTEVREAKEEWQWQRRAIAWAKADQHEKSHRHRPGDHE